MHTAMIAPRKYIQGRGALGELGTQVKELGSRPLLVTDEVVGQLYGPAITDGLRAAGLAPAGITFRGECSDAEITRIVESSRDASADVVVGAGGGKLLDAAKAVGHRLGVPWVIVPTIASTDAPTSALAVIYTDDGTFARYEFYPKNPDLVLVDTAVIARAPARFLSGGIGDGLSTWVEAHANLESRKPAMAGGLATLAAAALAELCWDTLFTHGVSALRAVERQAVTPAVEAVVEAATLLSGLGFESAGLAAAHAIHNGLTVLHRQTHGILHGEKVAFGTLAQLSMEGRPAGEIHDFVEFCGQVNLPTTLQQLNLAEVTDPDLMRVAEAACAPGETIHNMPFPVTPEMVRDAIVAADAYGRAYGGDRCG